MRVGFLVWFSVIFLVAVAGSPPVHGSQEPGPAAAAASESDPARDIFRIDVPQSWAYLPDVAERLAADARARSLPGDVPVLVEVQAWRGDGAGLVVTWTKTAEAEAETGAEVGRVARAMLDQVRAAPEDAGLQPGDTALVSWDEQMVDGMADARMEWTHVRNQTSTLSRAVVFQVASGHLHQVRADCMLAGEAGETPHPARDTCRHVLDSLAIVPPAAERRLLAVLPDAEARASAGSPGDTAASGKTGAKHTPAIREPAIGPGGVLVMEPSNERRGRSHQWMYVLGGALLLLAIYLTTRNRSSERAEQDDEDDEGDEGDQGDQDGERS